MILASKLSELEQFEYFAANYQQQKAEKSENGTKIKLVPLPSNKKDVCGWDHVVLEVKLNFKWGQIS